MDTKLYLDMDGVLADFDKRAIQLLGGRCSYRYEFKHGTAAFWDAINKDPEFFANLDPMPGMDDFVSALYDEQVGFEILTALPKSRAEVVEDQKTSWIRQRIGAHTVVHACFGNKPDWSAPGAILVDDRAQYRKGWEEAGGIFIHHHTFEETLACLRNVGVLAQ